MGYIFQQDLPRQCWKVGSKLSFSRTNLLSQLAEKCKCSIRKHFFLRQAAVVNWLSSCLTGKMERKNGMTPIPRRWSRGDRRWGYEPKAARLRPEPSGATATGSRELSAGRGTARE